MRSLGRGERRGGVRPSRATPPTWPAQVESLRGPHRGDGPQRAGARRARVRPRPARRADARGARARGADAVKLSYCIVNTNGADYLPACLEAVRTPAPRARCWCSTTPPTTARPSWPTSGSSRREGKAANDSAPAARGPGRVRAAAQRGRRAAPGRGRRAGARAGRRPRRGRGGRPAGGHRGASRCPAPGACRAWAPRWRWPPGTQKLLVTQSGGTRRREVGLVPVQRPAGAPQRPPSRWATSTPTSSSTPTRPTSASACATPAGGSCSSPPPWPPTTTSCDTDRAARGPPAGRVPPQPRPLPAQAPLHARAAAHAGAVGGRLPRAGAAGPQLAHAAPRPPRARGRRTARASARPPRRATSASRALGKVAPWCSPPSPARSVRPASCSPESASCCSAAWRLLAVAEAAARPRRTAASTR